MNLAQLVQDYVALKQSMGSRFRTEATILKAFCKAVGDVAITDVEPQQVESYLAGAGPVTRHWHRKYEALSGFYRFALGRGYEVSAGSRSARGQGQRGVSARIVASALARCAPPSPSVR